MAAAVCLDFNEDTGCNETQQSGKANCMLYVGMEFERSCFELGMTVLQSSGPQDCGSSLTPEAKKFRFTIFAPDPTCSERGRMRLVDF